MKRMICLLFLVLTFTAMSFSTVHTVTSSISLTFVPDTLSITLGDTIRFVLAGIHDVLEVSESTWNINDILPLDGGFSTGFGGGIVVPSTLGKHFYVCEVHALSGMKGTITVKTLTPNTLAVNSIVDRDGSLATTSDRIDKNWKLKIYKDSVGSGIVVDSITSGSTLSDTGLSAGTYVAVEADSAGWQHLSVIVDGVPQGVTPTHQWPITMNSGENHTVDFINFAPHTIINSGFTFLPESLYVFPGDTVRFVLESMHTAREVSPATWLADDTTSNGGFDLPFGGGNVVLTGAGIHYYVCVANASIGMKGRISVADTSGRVTIANKVIARWNMVSLPVNPDDKSVGGNFPSAISSAYTYQAGYSPKTILESGSGYWLKFGGAQTVLLHGFQVSLDSIPVSAGWNMVGSISFPVPKTAILSLPNDHIINSGLYGYNGGYFSSDTIWPGSAYWIRVSQSGTLILNHGAVSLPKSDNAAEVLNSAGKLNFRDADGREQMLYLLSDKATAGDITAAFALPPLPPAGEFDVRFASGSYVEVIGNQGSSEIPIQISSASYPLAIRWDMTSMPGSASLNAGTTKIALRRSGEVTVASANHSLSIDGTVSDTRPQEYALYHTYPNPFNPSATVRYQLPVQSRVRLLVYNVLGQLVSTLVDGVQEAGMRAVTWNSGSRASGIYFVRLDAVALDGSGRSVKQSTKMVLQK